MTPTSPHQRLHALGLALPPLPPPVGNFVPGTIHDTTLYLSGQGPLLPDGQLATGTVGRDVTCAEATTHARCCGLVLLAAMHAILGSLDHVQGIRRVFGMVNAAPDFADHPAVLNGCSDLFCAVFGLEGRHARSAVGMASLPGNITVEIEAVVAIAPSWRAVP